MLYDWDNVLNCSVYLGNTWQCMAFMKCRLVSSLLHNSVKFIHSFYSVSFTGAKFLVLGRLEGATQWLSLEVTLLSLLLRHPGSVFSPQVFNYQRKKLTPAIKNWHFMSHWNRPPQFMHQKLMFPYIKITITIQLPLPFYPLNKSGQYPVPCNLCWNPMATVSLALQNEALDFHETSSSYAHESEKKNYIQWVKYNAIFLQQLYLY